MKTARVHHAGRRRGSGVAARGASGAVGADTSHRGTASRIRRQLAISGLDWCLPAGLGTIRLDHWPQVRIDTRWAGANADAIRHHATELAALAPDVILAHGNAAVGALLQVTRTVPIVFPVSGDPVATGFVDSLARPGGNVTGFRSSSTT